MTNSIWANEYAAPHVDLREWVERVDEIGELIRVSGADWNLEIGADLRNGLPRHAGAIRPPSCSTRFPDYPAGFPHAHRRDQLAAPAGADAGVADVQNIRSTSCAPIGTA